MTFLDSSIFLEHVSHLSGPCVTICNVMPRPCLSQHQCSQIVSCRSVCKKSQSFPPTFLFHIFTIRACVSIPFWTCRRSPQWLVYKLTASPWGKTASKCNKKSVWMVMNAWYSHLCPKSILVSESVLVFWSCNCRFWKINIDLGFSFLLLEVYVCLDECNVCLSLSLPSFDLLSAFCTTWLRYAALRSGLCISRNLLGIQLAKSKILNCKDMRKHV